MIEKVVNKELSLCGITGGVHNLTKGGELSPGNAQRVRHYEPVSFRVQPFGSEGNNLKSSMDFHLKYDPGRNQNLALTALFSSKSLNSGLDGGPRRLLEENKCVDHGSRRT